MESRYLCKNHWQAICRDLAEAEQLWHKAMAQGMDALNAQQHQQAEFCFGAAYEAANVILDRQITHRCDAEIAANTLLAAQYLATTMVQQEKNDRAEFILKQLHEKFLFLCRNTAASAALRDTLCHRLIPYIEKLYVLVFDSSSDKQPNDELAH